MRYKIVSTGQPIVATPEFMELMHPGDFEEIPEVTRQTTHTHDFKPVDLLNSFSTAEAFRAAAISETSDAIRYQMRVLSYKRDVDINYKDEEYIAAINTLESEGVLLPDRAASYRLGLPLEKPTGEEEG